MLITGHQRSFFSWTQTKQRFLSSGSTYPQQNKFCHQPSAADHTRPSARNLGVLFSSNLMFEQHTTGLVESCFYHVRNISQIPSIWTCEGREIILQTFISSLYRTQVVTQNQETWSHPSCLRVRFRTESESLRQTQTSSVCSKGWKLKETKHLQPWGSGTICLNKSGCLSR